MNVCILTEGGKNIGFGHITRCTSIYQVFENFAIKPQLIVNGDETVHDFVKDENCRVFDWLNDRETLFAALRDADIAFIDSYLADYYLYEKISDIVGIGVYFDDNIRIEYPKGFVVNGAIFAERMPYPERKGVTYLLGAQYAPLRKEFWDVPAKSIRDSIESVMITFGGADIRNLTPKILKLLVDTYPALVKKVIIGKGFRNTSEIEAIKDHNTELVYYPDATETKKVMLESDIAISAGGQTLYELARIGVPTIAVAVADNQVDNICGWQKAGFAEYAGWWADAELTEMIKQKIKLLKDKTIREYKRVVGNSITDGAGSSRIVKELLSNFYQGQLVLRKATSADAEDLFNLANEDTVRKSSFSSGKVEWGHHVKWLGEKLADSNCLFFVVDYLSRFVGQVRLDMIPLQREAMISISLAKNIRGLGLSPSVINRSIEELLKIRKDVKLIKAYVKDGNIPSVRAFEKAGFRFLENAVINGCKARVYERVVSDG